MNDFDERIAHLSPEKQQLLLQRLAQRGAQPEDNLSIPRRAETTLPLLSYAQERLWFLDRLDPGQAVYNIPLLLRLRGHLHLVALEASLNEIVGRHEALRTTFQVVDGHPVQIIAPASSLSLPVIDLAGVSEPARRTAAQRHTTEQAQRPFDLAQGPLFRAMVLRLSAEEHELLLVMHHSVSDGWSLGVLRQELTAVYTAFRAGQPSPLPALPIQYADYSVWQRQWLHGQEIEKQRAYWREQLADAPPILALPTDRPRPAVQTYRGTTYRVLFPQELIERLHVLRQQTGTTLFMTLLGVFQILLWRYTGQEDVVVGSPIAGRTRTEEEGLIGFFVNSLVLRTDLSGNPSFREVLERVREVCLGAYAHQDLPFEKLVEDLQPVRSLSHSPLCQVSFNLHNALTAGAISLPELQIEQELIDPQTAMFDLSLLVEERGEGLEVTVEYSTDLFEVATIRRLVGHWQTLLESVTAAPDQPIATLPLLTEGERHQLLVKWNATQKEYPREECLHHVFEAQAARTPNATAVIFEGQQLTYDQLNSRANQLAHHLQALGVGPGVLVGLCVERSFEMVVGLWGILKAGGAYVPIDPTYPRERMAFMLADSQVAVLLTQQSMAEELSTQHACVCCLDTGWEKIGCQPHDNPVSKTTAEHPAYVIYTSGSTGRPKGVVGLHRSTLNRLHWMWQTYPFTPDEICCQKTSLSFVDSVWELCGPLLQGVPTVLIPDEVLKDPHRLVARLTENRITRLVLVPSLLRMILMVLETNTDDRAYQLTRLKYWMSSGEVLSMELYQRFRERVPDGRLLNLYGASEVAADATWYDADNATHSIPDAALATVPIGRPISNVQVYVLDPRLQPVPVGVPGELYVRGDGLAQGYHNNPELTTERFILDPFTDTPTSRLYKTGDFARYLPDGNLEFLGRTDNQVKIRGFRIELGEIEGVLCEHEEIRQAVLRVSTEGTGDERLVAYYLLEPDGYVTSTDLRKYLRRVLPDYMIPQHFIELDAIPLTPNGKVDCTALPAPVSDSSGSSRYTPPETELEKAVAGIWAEILGVSPIGVHDNFFELGGHSLLAVQVVVKAKDTLDIDVPLRSLISDSLGQIVASESRGG